MAISVSKQKLKSSVLESIKKPSRIDQMVIYGVLAMFVISMVFATFGKSVAGLKLPQIGLIIAAALVAGRRIIKKDFRFTLTRIDAAFFILIITGTYIPLIFLMARGIYITKAAVQVLLDPIYYYLWYRVCLDALPMPFSLKKFLNTAFAVIVFACIFGIMEFLRISFIDKILLKYYVVLPYIEHIHRAVSFVGDWEALGALAAYPVVIIVQLFITGHLPEVFGKYWKYIAGGILFFCIVALVTTYSFGGIIGLLSGLIITFIINGLVTKKRLLQLSAPLVIILGIMAYIFIHKAYSTGSFAIPSSWVGRFDNWQVIVTVVFYHVKTVIFGVQPDFVYPAASLDSTDSTYLLFLYRGGLLLVGGYLAFVAISFMRLRAGAKGIARKSLNWSIITASVTLLLVNAILGVVDPHFTYAAESHLLLTLLAISIGLITQNEKEFFSRQQQKLELNNIAKTLQPRTMMASFSVIILGSLLITGIGWKYNKSIPAPIPILNVPHLTFTGVPSNYRILNENTNIGTFNWMLTPGVDTTYLQGYAGQISAQSGQTVPIYVSSKTPLTYSLTVYRIGFYRGWGGRQMLSVSGLHSIAQGTWSQQSGLQGCSTCTTDSKTHSLEANWQQSYALTIGQDWISGVYLIKLISEDAAHPAQSYIPLVVTDVLPLQTFLPQVTPVSVPKMNFAVVVPVAAWEAANPWGGYSLYGHNTSEQTQVQADRAYAVSFDRPYSNSSGAGNFLDYEINLVRWMERSYFGVTYITDMDLEQNPYMLNAFQGVIVLGSDPYWTTSMYNNFQSATDNGHTILYMGANFGEWQARLAQDSLGNANRTLVSYQVSSNTTNPSQALALDPMYGKHNDLVTAQWSDPLLNKPTSNLTGESLAGYPQAGQRPVWTVSGNTGVFTGLLANTNLITGAQKVINANIIGGAIGAAANPNDTILGSFTYTDTAGKQETGATVVYAPPSGAFVFTAGTNQWAWGLDDFSAPGADVQNNVYGNPYVVQISYDILCHIGAQC